MRTRRGVLRRGRKFIRLRSHRFRFRLLNFCGFRRLRVSHIGAGAASLVVDASTRDELIRPSAHPVRDRRLGRGGSSGDRLRLARATLPASGFHRDRFGAVRDRSAPSAIRASHSQSRGILRIDLKRRRCLDGFPEARPKPVERNAEDYAPSRRDTGGTSQIVA